MRWAPTFQTGGLLALWYGTKVGSLVPHILRGGWAGHVLARYLVRPWAGNSSRRGGSAWAGGQSLAAEGRGCSSLAAPRGCLGKPGGKAGTGFHLSPLAYVGVITATGTKGSKVGPAWWTLCWAPLQDRPPLSLSHTPFLICNYIWVLVLQHFLKHSLAAWHL